MDRLEESGLFVYRSCANTAIVVVRVIYVPFLSNAVIFETYLCEIGEYLGYFTDKLVY
jgi:hypothetical protein